MKKSIISLFVIAIIASSGSLTVEARTPKMSHSNKNTKVELRRFPYPFRAMLAIDSDADHVDLRKFNQVHEFLNTYAHTPMGVGLGLDISDSFFAYNGSNIKARIDYTGLGLSHEMTMFKGISTKPSKYAPILLYYIKHGWIDTFHSAGDFSTVSGSGTKFKRSLEVNTMKFLKEQKARVILDFSDHGNTANPANFGSHNNAYLSYEQGDNPKSPYYISDLLKKEGVKFVWADEMYDIFSNNTMLFPIHLRSGSWMWGYHRYTGYNDFSLGALWNPYDLSLEISPSNLNELVKQEGYAIVATHLEGNADKQVLSDSAIHALIHLARMQNQGKILVARTSRLLIYNLVHSYIRYKSSNRGKYTYININRVADPVDGSFVPSIADLHGITWTVRHPDLTRVLINGAPVSNYYITRTRHTIGIKWYAKNTHNWAVNVNSKLYNNLWMNMFNKMHENIFKKSIFSNYTRNKTAKLMSIAYKHD